MVDIVQSKEAPFSPIKLADKIYSFVHQPPDPIEKRKGANIILLMGGNQHEASARKAYELWKEDSTRVIITTTKAGKFSPENSTQISEADDYYNILMNLRNSDTQVASNIQVIHTPISENTIQELKNFPEILSEHGISINKVLLVDIPVHQKRAYLNALKLKPNVEFVNCPNDSSFDTSNPDNQLRLVQEVERYTVYKDMETPLIPMDIMRACAQLRRYLSNIGKYSKERHNPRSLYETNVPERFYKHGEKRHVSDLSGSNS
ncbi:YdcF family protein [Candidatus Woesebacteria bacterium]|nr:YdcF family protein [Candidatus Woesebacteria bacterium]